jgi:hypothetical protein
MTTFVVWVLLVFHSPGDRLPTAGIFTYATKAECEAESGAWKRYACVKVEVPKK